jgi:hypothetical protein
MKIGILVTTFLRNHLLQECLDSISKYCNDDYYTIVVDQNNTSCVDLINIPDNFNGEFIKTEFDIGALKARNIAINRFHDLNIPYILMFADSMSFLSSVNLNPVIDFLNSNESYFLCGFNKINSVCTWECDMKKTHCFELDIPRRPIIEFQGLYFQPVDICRNIFLCKTEMLQHAQYDEDRKMGDHESSFYRWQQTGYKCFYLDSFLFGYKRDRNEAYNKYRDRFTQEKQKMMQKYNLTKWVAYSDDLKLKWKKEKELDK